MPTHIAHGLRCSLHHPCLMHGTIRLTAWLAALALTGQVLVPAGAAAVEASTAGVAREPAPSGGQAADVASHAGLPGDGHLLAMTALLPAEESASPADEAPSDETSPPAAPAAAAPQKAEDEEPPPVGEEGMEDTALWRRVRAFKLSHWSPRDFRAVVLLAVKARDSTATDDAAGPDEAFPDDTHRARPAAERVLRTAIDMRRRLLLVRADAEQLALVERLATALDVPADALPEGEIEGLLAVRLRHARPQDVVNILRQLGLHDASIFVAAGKLLIIRVPRGARQQAAEAVRAVDAP